MTFDPTVGQRFAPPLKRLAIGSVRKTAQAGLRGQVRAFARSAPQPHLVPRVCGQPRRILGVGIATGEGEDARGQPFLPRVIHLARRPLILHAVCQRRYELQAPVGGLPQDRSAIGTPLPLVKRRHHPLAGKVGKHQTRCGAMLGQAKASFVAPNSVSTTCLYHRRLFVSLRT